MSKWTDRAKGLARAIPGLNELSQDATNPSLKQALASMGYRFKNGDHTWLSAPCLSPDDLATAVRYLHACRVEALSGQQRASWLNAAAMTNRTDLLVWTRVSGQYRLLRADIPLAVEWIRTDPRTGHLKQPPANSGRILRTLLCQQTTNITQLCDTLSTQTNPFALLVDLTPFGMRDNPNELLDNLVAYFPGCPIVILSTMGDRSLEPLTESLAIPCQMWRQHLHDPLPLINDKQPLHKTVLTLIPDQRLDEHLLLALQQCRSIKEALKHQVVTRKNVLLPLYRVINAARSLAVPLVFHNQYQDKRRQGGLYPIRPIPEWLDIASAVSLPTGESEQLRDQAVATLRDLIEQLNEGTTGKTQALNQWLQTYLNPNQSIALVTSSEREAMLLRVWLEKNHFAELDSQSLTVIGIGSARDTYRRLQSHYDQVLVLGQLWETEQWALSLGERLHWLAYPSEMHWGRLAGRLWLTAVNSNNALKDFWWALQQVSPFALPDCTELLEEEEWAQCRGQYSEYNAITCDLPVDPEWIAALMAEPDPEREMGPAGPLEKGNISITTLEGDRYRYSEQQAVYTLKGKPGEEILKHIAANELDPGDQLVQLVGSEEECFALMDVLIEYATENTTEHKVYRDQANRWFTYVDHAIHNCGSLEAFHKQLCDNGVTIGIESVRSWSRHVGIAPNHKTTVVPVVAKLARINHKQGDLNAVINAQGKVHGLHSSMGRLLKRLALASSAGHTQVSGSAHGIINQELLADLVSVVTVDTIHAYIDNDPKPLTPHSLDALLKDAVASSNGRLLATTSAIKSAEESPYKDIDRVRQCLDVLNNFYYRVYSDTNRIKLKEAIAAGLRHHIDFKGDTAETTKGKHATYQRQYNGKTISIGKHLGLGTSRSPERCFRLHFHWDRENQQLVIHHAGRHLPTSQD